MHDKVLYEEVRFFMFKLAEKNSSGLRMDGFEPKYVCCLLKNAKFPHSCHKNMVFILKKYHEYRAFNPILLALYIYFFNAKKEYLTISFYTKAKLACLGTFTKVDFCSKLCCLKQSIHF